MSAVKQRYRVWQRGPYYFEIRDMLTGDYVDIKVGEGSREAAEAECGRRNAADDEQDPFDMDNQTGCGSAW